MSQQEDPPYPEFTIPPAWKPWYDDLYDYLLRNRVVVGPGVFVEDAPGGGKRLSTSPGGGIGGTTDDFTFKVYLRTKDNAPEIGVRYDSPLMLGIDHDIIQVVSGELNADRSSGWRSTNNGDLIWVEVAFDTTDWPTIIACSINNAGEGDDFGGGEVEYVDTNPGGDPNYVQSFLRIPLALIATDASDALYVEYQYVSGPILLIDGVFTGKDATGSSPRNITAKWRMM